MRGRLLVLWYCSRSCWGESMASVFSKVGSLLLFSAALVLPIFDWQTHFTPEAPAN